MVNPNVIIDTAVRIQAIKVRSYASLVRSTASRVPASVRASLDSMSLTTCVAGCGLVA